MKVATIIEEWKASLMESLKSDITQPQKPHEEAMEAHSSIAALYMMISTFLVDNLKSLARGAGLCNCVSPPDEIAGQRETRYGHPEGLHHPSLEWRGLALAVAPDGRTWCEVVTKLGAGKAKHCWRW